MASVAISNVAFDILSHTWPEVLSCYKLQYLRMSRVAGSRGVLTMAEQVEAEVIGSGDV